MTPADLIRGCQIDAGVRYVSRVERNEPRRRYQRKGAGVFFVSAVIATPGCNAFTVIPLVDRILLHSYVHNKFNSLAFAYALIAL